MADASMWTTARYDPLREIGAPAAPGCPTRSLWWLALAAAVGAGLGYYATAKPKKRGGARDGR